MNSIYSNSSTISDEILKSTILKIKKTACFLTVDPNYKNPETGIFDTVCSACKSYGLEYDGCDHTTFKDDPTPKWQTPVIISIGKKETLEGEGNYTEKFEDDFWPFEWIFW
jgi:hypothetical protein